MKWRHSLIAGALGCAGLASLSAIGFIATGGFRADARPSRAETVLADGAKEMLIPLQAGRHSDPAALTAAAIAGGQQTFGEECAVCHGAGGRGDAPLGQSMNPPAMDLGSREAQHWNDGELYWIIEHGLRMTGMPAWGATLSPEQIRELVAYLRTLRVRGGAMTRSRSH